MRYSFSRDDRDLPFAAHGRNLPELRRLGARPGPQRRGRALADDRHAHVQRDARRRQRPAPREHVAARRASTASPRSASPGRRSTPIDRGLSRGRRARLRDPRRRSQSAGRAADADAATSPTACRSIAAAITSSSGASSATTGRTASITCTRAARRRSPAPSPAIRSRDLLLGLPTYTLLAVNDNRQALRTWAANVFAQDDWRDHAALTVNAGDPLRVQRAAGRRRRSHGHLRCRDARARAGRARTACRAPACSADRNNVAPRVGVSWDLTGHGTLVLRGGYGLFYDSGTLIENSALYFNPPYFALQLFFPFARADLLGRTRSRPTAGFAPRRPSTRSIPTSAPPTRQQASVGLERVLRGDDAHRALRDARTGATWCASATSTSRRRGRATSIRAGRFQGFADILLVESQARSSYHALQLSAVRRHARGLSFRAAYTWSTSTDDTSAFLATDGDDNTPQNSRDLAAEWGPSDYDVRHRLVRSATWDICPAVRRLPCAPRLAGERACSPRSRAGRSRRASASTTATPATSAAAPSPTTGPTSSPAGTPGAVSYGGRELRRAPPYTFGNAGRNSLTGPGYAALDAVVAKRLTVAGTRTLELRLEVFNALNRAELPDPRQLRRSRDLRPEPRRVPGAPAAARGAVRVLSRCLARLKPALQRASRATATRLRASSAGPASGRPALCASRAVRFVRLGRTGWRQASASCNRTRDVGRRRLYGTLPVPVSSAGPRAGTADGGWT